MSQPFADVPPFMAIEIVASEATSIDSALHDAITRRAYQLFQSSGGISGRDEENWRQAELQTLREALEVRETGSWFSIRGDLEGISTHTVRLMLSPRRVLVDPGTHDIFFVASLPADVQPETAIASLKNGRLKLMVKRLETQHGA
jgi:hypothetical protein